MKVALWTLAVLAAVAVALAANVLLLRTDGSRTEPIGTLSPKLVRAPIQPATRTRPAAATTTTTQQTTTVDDHGASTGRDHPEDD